MGRLPPLPGSEALPTLATPAPCVQDGLVDLAACDRYCRALEEAQVEKPRKPPHRHKWDYIPTTFKKGLFPSLSKCVPVTSTQRQKPRLTSTRTKKKGSLLPPISVSHEAVSRSRSASRVAVPSSPRKEKTALTAFSAEVSKKAVVGVVLQAVDKERVDEKAGKRKHKLPFGKDDYMRLKSCFEAIDKDASGTLDWDEMQDLGELSGHSISYDIFCKMDSDGSGSVDFLEMLKCMFPHCATRALVWAASKWGMPLSVDIYQNDEPAWKEHFDREDAQEICDIFASFRRSPNAEHLTYGDLRANLSQSISNQWIFSALREYGTCDKVNVEQFAQMVAAAFQKPPEEHTRS